MGFSSAYQNTAQDLPFNMPIIFVILACFQTSGFQENKNQHRKCKTRTSMSFLIIIIRPAFRELEDEWSRVSAFALPGAFTRSEIHTAGTVPRYSGEPVLFVPLATTLIDSFCKRSKSRAAHKWLSHLKYT